METMPNIKSGGSEYGCDQPHPVLHAFFDLTEFKFDLGRTVEYVNR